MSMLYNPSVKNQRFCQPPLHKGALERRKLMDFYQVPVGFGLALSANTAAMNRYAQLDEQQKQDILDEAHNVRSEEEMYALVATLANGIEPL